jgi:uncharacterized damage-inducible protein DinB
MLESWLEYHRDTLEIKCEGLSPEQLKTQAVPPSTLSLLGLVRHMAEVERHWFRDMWTGVESAPFFYSEEDPDGDFNALDSVPPEEALAIWKAECDNSRKVSSASGLDDLAKRDRVRTGEPLSMRWIMIHMIEEYARHNGHADFLREVIDGSTGD